MTPGIPSGVADNSLHSGETDPQPATDATKSAYERDNPGKTALEPPKEPVQEDEPSGTRLAHSFIVTHIIRNSETGDCIASDTSGELLIGDAGKWAESRLAGFHH